MSKINSSELIDIFQQEMTKKNKKEAKKKQKLEKKFEKQENLEFEKIAKEELKKQIEAKKKQTLIKEETKETENQTKKARETKKETSLKEPITVHHFLYDTTFGFFLILLFLCTFGYSGFLLYSSFNTNNIIKSSLLVLFALSYIFSLTIQKTTVKKLAAMISSIAICLLMVFLIYIA